MKKIRCDSGALALPVEPDTARAVVEMIVSYYHIYGRVELDATYLRTGKITLVIYVMYMIILYEREYAAQVSYDPRLSAIMDLAVSDDMRTYGILAPAVQLRYE